MLIILMQNEVIAVINSLLPGAAGCLRYYQGEVLGLWAFSAGRRQ